MFEGDIVFPKTELPSYWNCTWNKTSLKGSMTAEQNNLRQTIIYPTELKHY